MEVFFMSQKSIAKILKIFCLVVALVGAFFFFVYAPLLVEELAIMFPEAAYLKWPGLFGIWVIAILCYAVLWNFRMICVRIGEDNSFCNENADCMKRMGVLSFVVAVLLTGAMIFLGCLGFLGIAYFIVYSLLMCVVCGVGVLCLALSALIRRAAQLKEENDLTI